MASEIQLTAATKLEPYLLMSKSAKGAAAAKLIQDVTAAPGVFVFSELLELPNIQEVGLFSLLYLEGFLFIMFDLVV